jgi:uncharacterized protein GlcG (DUF336 family)
MSKSIAAAALCTLLLAPAARADDPTVIAVKRLSLDTALAVAQGAVESCRQKGIQVGVTVVDRNGTIQAQLRDTLAPVITLEISHAKAATAAHFAAPTTQLASRADSPLAHVEGLLFLAGGLTIEAAGSLFGGVGVSGAPEGKVDEECAQAGIDKVIDALEMGL